MGEIFERALPEFALEWTGERLTTGVSGQVEIEHLHRYMMARDLCRGLDVLDVASGEGYGTALLATVARSATGVEISAEAAGHAARQYRADNLRYLQGDARKIPLADASVDVVTSFETIEHFYEQETFLAEVRRVLRPSGRFIVSSPDRDTYSPPASAVNPYHKRELSRVEFETLLGGYFPHVRVLCQRPMLGSVILSDDGETGPTVTIERRGERHFERSNGVSRSPYLVAVASDASVPPLCNSIYVESGEIGPFMARAAEHPALRTALEEATHRAESAEAAFAASRVEIETCMREAADERKAASKRLGECEAALTARGDVPAIVEELFDEGISHSSGDMTVMDQGGEDPTDDRASVQNELDRALSDLKQACVQRDMARLALRRSYLRAEQVWMSRLEACRMEMRLSESSVRDWQARFDKADVSAREWQARYEGLRGSLERFLLRSGLYRASRLVPSWVRRGIRARLFQNNAS